MPLTQTDCGRTHGGGQIIFCDFENNFRDLTSIFGLRTILLFVKNLFVDPIILLGFVIVFFRFDKLSNKDLQKS